MTVDRLVLAIPGADEPARRAVVAHARRRGFTRFALAGEPQEPVPAGEERYLVRTDGFHWDRGNGSTAGPDVIPIFEVGSPIELGEAETRLRRGQPVAIRWTARERVIPLENLVAARAPGSVLWVVTDRAEQIPGYLGALEHGADRIAFEVQGAESVDALESVLERAVSPDALEWTTARVRRTASAGMGDRVIVDTTSLLGPEEGLLVGSQAAFLFHAASEAVGSRYTRPRPFRVNAGAAHSYVLLADGATRYLSELEPGDRVLAVTPKGSARAVRVGRLKIERRPLVLVEAEANGRRFTVFPQEAETVRLSGPADRFPATEIGTGTELFGVLLPRGRHMGVAVEETVEER